MSSEQRIAEAITDVTHTLAAAGAPEAGQLADQIVKGLMRDGWRPRGPRYEPPTGKAGTVPPPERVHELTEALRAALRGEA